MEKRNQYRSLLQCKLHALHTRLSPVHKKYAQVEVDLGKKRSGDYGEASIDYYLSQINGGIPYPIIRGARLQLNQYHFQMDTLLLYPSFFILLETKHLTGTLFFDPDFQQLIQIKKDDEISRQDPILQVKMQYNQFKRWLSHHQVDGYSGFCFVVITNQNAIVKALSNPAIVQEYVVRNPALTFKLEHLIANTQPSHTSSHSAHEIFSLICEHHVPRNENILKEFDINPMELITGVTCPKCNELAMERLPRRWRCIHCNHVSMEAHIQTLMDYSLLISSSITTKEVCRFLHIPSMHIARQIMKSLFLEKTGSTVNAKYCLKSLWKQQNAPQIESGVRVLP
ncbi:NERD domain-containing protein [Sutcliffiella horikoshii]|uniref:nuclease-related domain-containing protein n=1 Tax=Sutcliffiella horikoshii TaxID=79883 RepID=UPI002041607E|nr:nuclease-related domain-containing protein [Sutcliffiella horikoshii]MCM3616322.1 NERD domain-containing protein [Sutcliffiella horikoshii]